MIVYDLQRYHPEFAISVLDQVLEDLKVGMEVRSSASLKFWA
jgi:regulator of nonsense transcripts 2